MKTLPLLVPALLACAATSMAFAADPPPPPQAAAVGYMQHTFGGGFNAKTVDVNGSEAPGYSWYATHFFWMKPTSAASMPLGPGDTIVLNSDGTPRGNGNTQICTSVPGKSVSGIVGQSFGGGAYFEATFAFDSDAVLAQRAKAAETHKDDGWPSWWALSVDSTLEKSYVQSWGFFSPNDPGRDYANSVESDFFEFDYDKTGWGSTVHQWYGVYKYKAVNPPYDATLMKAPPGTDFSKFHKYGCLWVPATSTSAGATKGYVAYYFDDKRVDDGRQTWDIYAGQAAPPTEATPWTFGILDQQHNCLILGSGVNEPMTVQSVNVWQASANWNIGTGTLFDPLRSFSRASLVSGPLVIDSQTPELFDGDAFRAVRSSAEEASLTYNLADIRSFTVRVFEKGAPATSIRFEVSTDGKRWSPVRKLKSPRSRAGDGWSYRDISCDSGIPAGAGFLRITLAGTKGDFRDVEIGQVRIN